MTCSVGIERLSSRLIAFLLSVICDLIVFDVSPMYTFFTLLAWDVVPCVLFVLDVGLIFMFVEEDLEFVGLCATFY